MYVIKRTDQGGGYVTVPGSEHSYSKRLESAQIFKTYEDAYAACCVGNEIPVPLSSALHGLPT